MKKVLRLSLAGLAITASLAACKGNKSGSATDSARADSASTSDTVKHADTTLKVDTVKPATDTSDAKTDTVSKTVHSKTEIKKTEVKGKKH